MAILTSAPAVGIIDDSNNLTLSWTPVAAPGGSFTDYSYWNITIGATIYRSPSSGSVSDASKTQTFTQILSSGNHTITMQAFDNTDTAITNPWQTNGTPAARTFPSPLSSTSVAFSLSSVLLGQTLTVTLDPLYTGADQWQVIWPDNTSTGWLPLSANVVAKAFSVAGAQNIVIQTRYDYSASQYNPPTSLIRQTSKQIFVVDQQAPTSSSSQGGLTGDLGIGGQQGFEITDASSTAVEPNPWEVIARAFVRDTINNELKLLVATTRFSNASSLLGTMAIDVFPIEGRPHSIELIQPIYQLTQNANTETTPVKIQTSTLPTLIVGKTVTQALGGTLSMQVKTGTGIEPYLWSVVGLPSGLSMSSSGVINGTPLELGQFSVTFAVQDGGDPFSIDEVTLTLTVDTDLKVQIASGQTDAQGATLAPLGTSLGVAQVGKVYSVQMQVGNTNPNTTTPGGLPPYTWSIPAGSLPIGLSINPSTGVISGLPCTYNSTTDFNKTYSAIVQVTDAIGAKATQTYSMTLIAAPLQFGQVNQQTIYSAQDFKLAVPIFGGQSPYTLTGFFPDNASYYVTPTEIIDGQVEVLTNIPTTGTGTRTFIMTATDAAAASTGNTSLNFQCQNEISDIRISKAFVDHYWNADDAAAATPLPVLGDFTGYTLNGTTLALSSVANASGGSTVYTGTIGSGSYSGQTFTVTGFSNAVNNGQFLCTANDATTITLSNAAGVSETASAKAVLSQPTVNGIAVAVDNTVPQVDVTGPATVFRNAQYRVPLGLLQGSTPVATISREFTLLAHDDTANPGDIGSITSFARPFIVGDAVGFNPRKPYFNSPNIPSFNAVPNTNWTARVQTGSSLPPGLSLDANTGLIYGTLYGLATTNSVVEYIDGGGTVHGTVTINWTTFQSDFQVLDLFSNADGHQIGTPFSNTAIIQAPSGVTFTSTNVVAGTLPTGVSLGIDPGQTTVILNGTPTEAGYFDLWFRASGNNGQFGYIYHRLAIDYTKPMVILTSSLPGISSQPYSTTLQGYGGIPPYTWSSSALPSGLTLVTNADNTATLSGTLTSPPGVSPTDLGLITFTLTDTRGAASSVSKQLDLVYDNRLRITTPVVPTIIASADYAFTMQAAGGVPPYTWQIDNSPTLPTGITFDAIAPSYGPTGAFSGITSTTGYDQFLNITVKDSTAATSTGYNLSGLPYEIKTGAADLLINQNGVGTVNRGVPYQGTLAATDGLVAVTAPVAWQVAPTPSFPNTMLPGLTLTADAGTQGLNAVIAGTYQGIPHQVEGILQIVGNGATALVTTKQSHGFTNGQSVTIAGTTNFNGTYTIQTPITTATFTIPHAFVGTENPLSATATVTANLYQVRVVATDAAGEVAVALVQLNTGTDLTITTGSLPNATVGGSYSVNLAASGGVPSYTWSIDATSVDTLSGTGLALSGAGVISGTATSVFTKNITFRVTDALGGVPNIARVTLQLKSQASGLTISTPGPLVATSGRAYSSTPDLQAAGSPNLPYTWSIVGGSLPAGLTLNVSTGVISGTSTATGFNSSITFRVTDSIGAHVDKAIQVKVVAGLALVSGIDFTDSLNTGIIGYVAKGVVDSITPRPNLSFYVVATGVVSTSTSQISVTTGNPNVTAQVTSITSGNALIKLSGSAFPAGSVGNNTLSISVTDSGVNVSGTFTWVVYDDGILRIGATLPTELTTP